MTGARCRYNTKITGGECQHYGNTSSHKLRACRYIRLWGEGSHGAAVGQSVSQWAGGWVRGLDRTKTGSWQNNGSGGMDAEVDKI